MQKNIFTFSYQTIVVLISRQKNLIKACKRNMLSATLKKGAGRSEGFLVAQLTKQNCSNKQHIRNITAYQKPYENTPGFKSHHPQVISNNLEELAKKNPTMEFHQTGLTHTIPSQKTIEKLNLPPILGVADAGVDLNGKPQVFVTFQKKTNYNDLTKNPINLKVTDALNANPQAELNLQNLEKIHKISSSNTENEKIKQTCNKHD